MITIRYSCPACGLVDEKVDVRDREPGENVVTWTRDVMGWAINIQHRRRSPGCNAKTAEDVKIPMTGRNIIGGPIIQ